MTSKICFLSVLFIVGSNAWAQDSKQLPDKITDKIVGAWKIQRIAAGNEDVAKNPTSGQWIEFRSDGTYLNHATSIDSGLYRIKEDQATLYLESTVNKDPAKKTTNQVTEWSVAFENDGLIMQRRSTGKREHVDRMKYFYTKVGKEGNTVNN